jgi:hypothetical protein
MVFGSRRLLPILLTGIIAVPAGRAHAVSGTVASPNLVANGNFANSFTGWSTTGTNGSGPGLGPEIIVTNGKTAGRYGDVIKADPFTYSPTATGTNAAYFVDDNANEKLSQAFVLTAGLDYEVGFDFYLTTSGSKNPGGFTLTATLGTQSITTVSSTQTNQIATWYHIFSTYTPTVTGTYSFVFNYISANGTSKDVVVDDVYVQAPPVSPGAQNKPVVYAVPEPSGMAMLAIALGGLGLIRRHRSGRA